MHLSENQKAAVVGGLWDGKGECPDLSDPPNYEKAFLALVERGLFVERSMYLATGGPWVRYTIWPKEGQRSDEDNPLVQVNGPLTRSVAREALAALYDAEHGEGK